MKRLYFIGGTMGVGKTAVCQQLKRDLPNSVFLDGDWCWDSDPFQVTEETKAMVLDNICFLLNRFIHCSAYETIIFGWVMHQQEIIDTLLRRLDTADCDIKCISLMACQETLRRRIEADIEKGVRSPGAAEHSIARIPLYHQLKTRKISTDHKSVREVAAEIAELRPPCQTTGNLL